MDCTLVYQAPPTGAMVLAADEAQALRNQGTAASLAQAPDTAVATPEEEGRPALVLPVDSRKTQKKSSSSICLSSNTH